MLEYSRVIQKVLFYLSSFIPLYILLIVQNIQVFDKERDILPYKTFFDQFSETGPEMAFWIVLLLLLVLSSFGVALFFMIYVKSEGRVGTIQNAEFIREDTMGYIVTYIVPLISMDITSIRSLVINLLLFIIIGSFYVKNDQIFMNPIYNIFGYNVFSAEENIYITKIRKSKLKIIAKRNLDVIKINLLGDIYVLKEHSDKRGNSDDLY